MVMDSGKGAAFEFSARRFGGGLIDLEANPVIGVTATEILGGDPERVLAIIINLSANDVFISPRADVSTTKGIQLAANGGSATFDAELDGTLVTRQLFGIAGAAASQLYTLILRREFTVSREAGDA